ncbi:hypothetical protein BURK1_00720 [Burkholderiales bacterium]|nr:hypothetical protein BURK1_00720 [Burkholderiales bacterium]
MAVVAALAFGASVAVRAADTARPDCARVDATTAASLPAGRAPHIVLLQGSLGIVTMAPFGAFLAGMGYPTSALADPRTGEMTTDSDLDGRTLAGMLAWLYERDGVRPLIVGHSKGGGVVIDALRALAGAYGDDLPVVDPRTLAPEPRTHFRDPDTGEPRRVVELVLPFAAAIATGRLPRILRGQFELARVLRDVPDSTERFTGFAIPYDPIAGTFAGDEDPYRATGRAQVRNVVLPAATGHIDAPRAAHLALDPQLRLWIDRYRPGVDAPLPEGRDTTNLVQAAELWFDIKRAWCGEAQRTRRAAHRVG